MKRLKIVTELEMSDFEWDEYKKYSGSGVDFRELERFGTAKWVSKMSDGGSDVVTYYELELY